MYRDVTRRIKSDARAADSKDVKQKSVLTIVSIAIIAGLAIYLGNVYLKPVTERAEA